LNNTHAFGDFLKTKRNERKRTVRELAESIGVSAGYYGEIEAARRTPVDVEFISKVITLLHLSDDDGRTLYDLAGKDRSIAPPDLTEYINENKVVRDALRLAKEKACDEDWLTFMNNL